MKVVAHILLIVDETNSNYHEIYIFMFYIPMYKHEDNQINCRQDVSIKYHFCDEWIVKTQT